MRRLLLISLSVIALLRPLTAQQFEGTIAVRIGGPGGTGSMVSRMTTKGDKVLTVIALPGVAGQDLRMITDNRARTMIMLTPFPPGMVLPKGVASAKGIITVRDFPAPAPSPSTKPINSDIRKLGSSQTIAGINCDDYEATGETGQVVRMCLAASLGRLTSGALGEGGQSGQPAPWARALGNKPLMPLKVWKPDGTTVLEVMEIKRQLVASRVFDIPPGYVDVATALKNRTGASKP
jgi:hypothetical protein